MGSGNFFIALNSSSVQVLTDDLGQIVLVNHFLVQGDHDTTSLLKASWVTLGREVTQSELHLSTYLIDSVVVIVGAHLLHLSGDLSSLFNL